jgi:hypothetical protein
VNRPTAWIAPAALGLGLGIVLALWWVYPVEDPPAWVIATSVGAVALALFVAIVGERQDRRAQAATGPPRAASVEEFLAAVDALYGTAGAASGAASPQVSASWNGEPYTRHGLAHDHPLGNGTTGHADCPGCLATLAVLITLAEAQAAAVVTPEASGVVLCGDLLGAHRCDRKGAHDTHHCECGTVWGRASALGGPWMGKPLPPFRG